MRSKKILVKQRGNLLDLHHCKIEFLKKTTSETMVDCLFVCLFVLKYKLVKEKTLNKLRR